MPTLDFKGKQFVYSHHHSVPFKELVIDKAKSLPKDGKPSLDDNLIINGDNLHGLKALLPQYAGKVKCIYIDPPYNTGNEGWCYNDNVNSPLMKEWIKKNANPVDKEDLERHDKWLCMMYPRLKLLHELLADDGVIFVSIDDNEVHHLRAIMDEIWGEDSSLQEPNMVANLIWEKVHTRKNSAKYFSEKHEHLLCYAKIKSLFKRNLLPRENSQYKNPDSDPKGPWKSDPVIANNPYSADYTIRHPDGTLLEKPRGKFWRYSEKSINQFISEKKLIWKSNSSYPVVKRYLSEVQNGLVPETILYREIFGDTSKGTKEVGEILNNTDLPFNYPKPSKLIKLLLQLATDKDSIILDSFAGSGTTAHAVLDLNKEDGGNRKFILVEMEDYANDITAERVRRVIKGVPSAKDEKLKNGLGGSFTFCSLGEEFNIEKILTGESLPKYESLANYVFYTATGKSLDKPANQRPDYYIGETDLYEVYLIYKPDIAFLRSNDSALNSKMVEIIKDRGGKKEKLVFASAKYMGQNELKDHKITFCQLPYAIHKVVGK